MRDLAPRRRGKSIGVLSSLLGLNISTPLVLGGKKNGHIEIKGN